MPARRRKKRLSVGYGDLALSLLFIFPLFLAYHTGVAFTQSLNGVDFVTRVLLEVLEGNHELYLAFQGGLGMAYAFILWLIWHEDRLPLQEWVPLVLESTIYALTLGSVIVLVMDPVFGLSISEHSLSDVFQAVVISLGAGVYEELVFRLGIMGGLFLVLCKLDCSRAVAVGVSLLVSSVLFSFAHHLGANGELFRVESFFYRIVAGAAFGLIFYFRSLAHAVYAHVFYDLYVFLLRA